MVKKNLLFLCFSFMIFVLNACGSNNLNNNADYLGNNQINRNNQDTGLNRDNKKISEYARNTPYTIPETVEKNRDQKNDLSEYNTRRASKIASTITRFPEVEKATVVITGNTALVGINLINNMSNDKVDQMKLKIEKKIRAMDGELKNVSVTSSPQLVDRIFTIAEDIGQGRPITGLADELGSILRRVTPTI